MNKWLLPVVAALTIAVVGGPTLAGARSKRTHKCSFNVTGLFATVKVKSGSPPVNGRDTDAATLDGKLCGKRFRGAARGDNRYPTPGTFETRNVAFGPQGSLKSKFTGSGKVNPDGSVSFSGKGKITGGTGRYKGATGSLSFTGTAAPDAPASIQHIKGKLKY